MRLKRFVCAALSVVICISAAACGSSDTDVVDYGTSAENYENEDNVQNTEDGKESVASSSNASTSTLSLNDIERGESESLRDIYGDRIDWTDEFAVNNTNFKVNAYFDVPAMDSLNAYHNEKVSDGKDSEDELVEKLFGGTATKIEELKYTNETDYMPLMYKYRAIMTNYEWSKVAESEDVINYYYFSDIDFSVIKPDSEISYKWLDETNLYIHMYEGQFNGKKFGLLLAYDYLAEVRYIFFEPISINDYFPGYNIKSLITAYTNNSGGNPVDVANECTDSIEAVQKKADEDATELFGIDPGFTFIENAKQYSVTQMDNIIEFTNIGDAYGSVDLGPTMLMFSNVDYTCSMYGYRTSEKIEYKILADQTDHFAEYQAEKGGTIYDYLIDNAGDPEDTPEYYVDGYAVYLSDEYYSQTVDASMNPGYNSSRGCMKYTSNGLYSVDLELKDIAVDVTENVKLLEFDKVKESLKTELQDWYKPEEMDNPEYVEISYMSLSYSPQISDDEIIVIPVWNFDLNANGGRENRASMTVNAMDGTIINLVYWNN